MLTRQLSTGNGERDLSAVYIDVERVTSLSMPMIEMSKWVVSVGRPVARHDFSPVQARPDTDSSGFGPAWPVKRAGFGRLRRPACYGPARHELQAGTTAARKKLTA